MGITLGDLFVRIKGDQADLDRDLAQAEKKTQDSANRMGGFFSGAMQHAVGGAILGGVRAVGNAIGGALGGAWEATKSYESMTAAMQTLLTKEIQTQSVQTKRIYIGQKTIQVTEGEQKATLKKGESVEDLNFKIQKLNNSIAVQSERLTEATSKGKESAAELEARRLRIQSMEQQLAALQGRMGKEGTVVSKNVAMYRTEKTQAIDMMTARKMAAERTQELLKWSQKLAIESPFSQEDVVKAMKLGMALGYTSDQTQRLTTANINYAAATGASGDVMSRITLALGQMQAKGKLMGGEMLQLTEAGVPMREILVESGKIAGLTTDNFDELQRKGLIPARMAYEAYVEYMEKHFATAAKDQANTLAGLQNSFEDLGKVVLRAGIGPLFKSMQPAIQKVVELLQKPAVLATVEKIGQGIGDFFSKGVNGVLRFFEIIDTNVANGVKPIHALRLALVNILPNDFLPLINGAAGAIDRFMTAFDATGNLGYAARSAFKAAFGEGANEMFGPVIEAVFKLPQTVGEAFGKLQKGDLAGALKTLWGDLGIGTLDVAGAIASLLAKLGIEINKEDVIKQVGDKFFSWGAAALNWMTERVTSKDFEDRIIGENGIAKKLGTAAGNTVAAITGALVDWVKALAGFPSEVKPEMMDEPIVSFAKAVGRSIRANMAMKEEIGKAFWEGVLEGIGVNVPAAEEVAKLLNNPLKYASEDIGAKLGNNIRNMVTGANQPNRFQQITKDELISPDTEAQVATVGTGMADGIKAAFKSSLTATPVNEFEAGIMGVINSIMAALGIQSPSTYTAMNIGTPMAEGIGVGFTDGIPSIEQAMREIWSMLDMVTGGWAKGFVNIGRNIIGGLIEGVKQRAADFKEAILNVLPPAIRAVLAQMGIASPSKVTMGISNHIMDGLILPMEKRAAEVRDAMQSAIQPLTRGPAMPQLAGGTSVAGRQRDVNVYMGGVTMANEMDAYSQAYRMAKRVRDGI